MNVPKKRLEVSIALHEKGSESSLEKMADAAVTAVEVLRIGRLQRVHDPRERDRALFDGQVNVVGHQAIGVEPEFEPIPIPAKPIEIVRAVGVVGEYGSALVSSDDDVVNGAGALQSRASRHTDSLSRRVLLSGKAAD